MTQLETLLSEVPKYQPNADLDLLTKAYRFSELSHQGQQRASGEPYLSHPLEVAGLLVAFKMDVTTVTAGLLHDVLVCLGAMSLTDREMSLPVLAALLTIIGYSVNDTIVAYDRVRENRGKGTRKGQTFESQINAAINQTLSRTVLTALTVFFSTAVLYLFGGKVLEDLAFVLTIGVVTGTFSTIYIAGSLIVDWTNWVEGRTRRGKKVMAKA